MCNRFNSFKRIAMEKTSSPVAQPACQILINGFVANNGMNIREALQQMVDMDVAVYYNGLARKNIYIRKAFLTINGETIRNLVGGAENGK